MMQLSQLLGNNMKPAGDPDTVFDMINTSVKSNPNYLQAFQKYLGGIKTIQDAMQNPATGGKPPKAAKAGAPGQAQPNLSGLRQAPQAPQSPQAPTTASAPPANQLGLAALLQRGRNTGQSQIGDLLNLLAMAGMMGAPGMAAGGPMSQLRRPARVGTTAFQPRLSQLLSARPL